jgi:hypothetical protein
MTDISKATPEVGPNSTVTLCDKSKDAMMTFDRGKYEQLLEIHQWALDEDVEELEFEGNLMLTNYAGYVLEYLDLRLD